MAIGLATNAVGAEIGALAHLIHCPHDRSASRYEMFGNALL
jgi:hypothetical protein